MVEDRVQKLDSVTCDIFQLYFYDNLFYPNGLTVKHKNTKSKIQIKQ